MPCKTPAAYTPVQLRLSANQSFRSAYYNEVNQQPFLAGSVKTVEREARAYIDSVYLYTCHAR